MFGRHTRVQHCQGSSLIVARNVLIGHLSHYNRAVPFPGTINTIFEPFLSLILLPLSISPLMQSSPTNHETTKPSRKHAQASNARQFIRNANDDAVCSGVLPGDFGEHPNPDFPPAIKELASISHIALDNIKDILNSVISWLFITSYFAFLVLLLFQAFDFRNWHTIQQTFGLVDPLTNTSLIFAAPRTSGPYLLHDFDALHKIQRSATQALLDGREVASRFVLENDSDIFNTVRRLDLTMNA